MFRDLLATLGFRRKIARMVKLWPEISAFCSVILEDRIPDTAVLTAASRQLPQPGNFRICAMPYPMLCGELMLRECQKRLFPQVYVICASALKKSFSSTIRPYAEEVDRRRVWPEKSLRALADAGLFGLQVPERLGGHGQGLLALAVMTETVGAACASSAMYYGMHCVGTAVITAKATRPQEERYLRKIAEGKHITTLALPSLDRAHTSIFLRPNWHARQTAVIASTAASNS